MGMSTIMGTHTHQPTRPTANQAMCTALAADMTMDMHMTIRMVTITRQSRHPQPQHNR